MVIPLFNKAPYISRTLSSVLTQTFSDFEVVVIDDGSTDGGARAVQEMGDPRVRMIQQQNRGVSTARNRGIEEAQADLIAFLDADDEWLPDHLATLVRLREKYPQAGAYGTAYLIARRSFRSKEVTAKLRMPRKPWIPLKPWEGIIPSYFKAAALGYTPISASNVAITKAVLKEMNGFRTDAWWGEDSDLWGRIAMNYPIAFSWEGMVIYHADASNRATMKVQSVREHIFVTTARKALEAGEVPKEIKEDLTEYVALKQIQTAQRNLAAGQQGLARANLRECKTRHLIAKKYRTLLRAYMSH